MAQRTALITGGTDGIGKATAASLLRDGWTVVITGRNAERCADTVRQLSAAQPGAQVSALTGDLLLMSDVAALARDFTAAHQRLDLLCLNANAITQRHTLTADGFEANLAIGFFGRALLALALEPLLQRTAGAQVLSVVGLNLDRLDFDEPSTSRGFSSMKALGRWQWAMQLFTREWTRLGKVTFNTYMPGLVRTKILANEPQPMRLFVQLANVFMGVPVSRSGDEVLAAVRDVTQHDRRDGYFNRTTFKGLRALDERPDDAARLWALTDKLLAPWRTAPRPA